MGSLLRLIPSLHLPAELSLSFPTLEPAQNASSQPVRDFQSAHTSPSPALPPFPSSAPFPFCLFRNCPGEARNGSRPKWGFCHRGETAGKTKLCLQNRLGAAGWGDRSILEGREWGELGSCRSSGSVLPQTQRGRNWEGLNVELNQSLVTGSIQAAQLEGEVIKIHFREKKKLGFLQDLTQSKAVIFFKPGKQVNPQH